MTSETYVPTGTGATAQRTRFIVMGQRGYQAELVDEAGSTQETQRHEIGDVSVTLKPAPGATGLKRQIAYKTLDCLGSPLGLLDENGNFRQRDENDVSTGTTQLAFSPFGSAREANFQVRAPANQMPGRINLLPGTRQGFTGHEHLDSLGLIHMNGRVYDHRLGRFLSVDPFIQFPANSQSLNPYSYIMNNPMAGTDPSGYVIRSHRRTPLVSESCMGREECERQQTFYGPVNDFRGSFSSGGAPSGTWNGWEAKQAIRKAQNNAKGTVQIGELVDLRKGVMLAQEGTMSDEDIRDILGEEDPRAGARRGAKSAGRIMDALGDVIEPGPEDAVGIIGKLKDGNRVGEAIGQSLDELSDLRKASDAAKITKPVNLPGWRSVSIDMEHVASGHMAGGAQVSSKKTLFPESMTAVQVERAVRQAYRYGQRVSSQGDRVLVRGEYDGIRIEIWVNTTTRTIETGSVNLCV